MVTARSLAVIVVVTCCMCICNVSGFVFQAPFDVKHLRQRQSCGALNVYSGDYPSDVLGVNDDMDHTAYKSSDDTLEKTKEALIRDCVGSNRGLSSTSEERKGIASLIERLEMMNPNPSPNDGFADGTSPLTGEWKLLYTDALDVLSLGWLPGIVVAQIYQNVGPDGTEISNIVELQPSLVPIIPSSVLRLTVAAKGTIASSKRLNLTFISSKFAPVSFLGMEVESTLPPLKIDFPQVINNVGWLDHTFVDEDIRVGRSIGDNCFVLLRVGS